MSNRTLSFRVKFLLKPFMLAKSEVYEFSEQVGEYHVGIGFMDCPLEELPSNLTIATRCVAWTTIEVDDIEIPFLENGIQPGDKVRTQFYTTLYSALYTTLQRAVFMFRWRHGIIGSFDPILYNFSIGWSFDEVDWKPVFAPAQLKLVFNLGYVNKSSSAATMKDVHALVSESVSEPLGHELFNEAYALQNSNPRSALIIGVAALETGIKECASLLVPQSQWLIRNTPSPPLDKMLKHLLPELPVRNTINGKVVAPSKRILKIVRDAMEARNGIVHGKSLVNPRGMLNDFLTASRDLLYLFDFYSGHIWAWDLIRQDTKAELLGRTPPTK